MVTVLFLFPNAGAQNSGVRVISPENSHSRYAVFPLDHAAEAHAALESDSPQGRIVLVVHD
jgi:hypothetical protein